MVNSAGLCNQMVTGRLGDFLGDCSLVNERCPHLLRDLFAVCDCKGPVEWPVMTVRIHFLSPFLSMHIFHVYYHPRLRIGNNFSWVRVCLSVFLSVRLFRL